MSQGGSILGAHDWAYLRRDPDYRADWAVESHAIVNPPAALARLPGIVAAR